MKLTNASVKVAMSLIPNDIVFYRDEKDNCYRLIKIPYSPVNEQEALRFPQLIIRIHESLDPGEQFHLRLMIVEMTSDTRRAL